MLVGVRKGEGAELEGPGGLCKKKKKKVLMANRFLLLPAGSSLFVSVHVSVTKSELSGDWEKD